MVEGMAGLSRAEFTELVRDALHHLHDVASLQIHSLAQLAEAQPGGSTVLRGKLLLQMLLDTIESLHPPSGTSAESRDWRTYRILELRYLEGLSASDVGSQLAVSRAQYQRDHARGLEAVASSLWDRWHPSQRRPAHQGEVGSWESLVITEVEQLARQMRLDDVDLVSILAELATILRPAIEKNRTAFSFRPPPDCPSVCGDRVALRQVFLGLLTAALERAAGGAVDVSLDRSAQDVGVTVVASPGHPSVALAHASQRGIGLEVAQRLAQALGGGLEAEPLDGTGPWSARVALPLARRPVVLVVDNHADFIGLVARYLAEHDWQVVGAEDARQAELRARELQPRVILLDVMMPGQDGWDLLAALKARPETRQIPVAICSVLYQPEVAEALGAVDYLTKPVSQAALLAALARYRQGIRVPEPSC